MGTPKKKKKSQTLEAQFQVRLNLCTKTNDLAGAAALFDSAVSDGTRLTLHHFNALLHICTASLPNPHLRHAALELGFRVFRHVSSPCVGVQPNEATVTAAARLAAAKLDGDYAFELVKSIGKYNALPRLRTYGPALFCFVEGLEAEKAYEVEDHMVSSGVGPEEAEITALLRVSSETGRGEKVYEYLHKLRDNVRCVSEPTAEILEEWFKKGGCGGGYSGREVGEIREAVLRNGGGWHGKGWVGEGDWVVRRGGVDSSDGRCLCCGKRLFRVDIGDEETERFANSVASLAMEREAKSNFSAFQDWLDKHSDYEAIVDGANVGLYQQNFADGDFSVSQLDAVVTKLRKRSGNKWPLVVLHNKRSRALLENPLNRKLVDEWLDKGILYTTPNGSNDDWYWLYATVKLKCFLVTNDEMRDHIFELIGSSFFLKWKERHQVRYTFVKGNLQLQMPPPYSSVIQESEKGSWHVPLAARDDIEESERMWLCITRPNQDHSVSLSRESLHDNDDRKIKSFHPFSCSNTSHSSQVDSSETSDDKTAVLTGKRKERSPDVGSS